MPNPYFSFKQFTVFHDQCAMKVGVDGVLIGAWTPTATAQSILDVGTGSGLIALMLAQRCPHATIHAVDVAEDAIRQANFNVQNSPWSNRISLHQFAFQDFVKSHQIKYDLIVSNPPYFVNSLKATSDKRNLARHTDSLSHLELVELSASILNPNGVIAIILPLEEGRQCIHDAAELGLYCKTVVEVHPKPNNQAKRLLIAFCLIKCEMSVSQLYIETDVRHQYSSQFSELVKDFYLKL